MPIHLDRTWTPYRARSTSNHSLNLVNRKDKLHGIPYINPQPSFIEFKLPSGSPMCVNTAIVLANITQFQDYTSSPQASETWILGAPAPRGYPARKQQGPHCFSRHHRKPYEPIVSHLLWPSSTLPPLTNSVPTTPTCLGSSAARSRS